MSEKELPAITLLDVFDEVAMRKPENIALLVERPVPEMQAKGVAPSMSKAEWKKWTTDEYVSEAKHAARGFVSYGLEVFGCVTVFGFNAPEWNMSTLAAIMAGAKISGIYPSDSEDNVCYKLHHSASAVCVVEDELKLKKVLQHSNELPDLRLIVTYMCKSDVEVIQRPGFPDLHILTWDKLVAAGKESDLDDELAKRRENIRPGHACALIYTSGTTGSPKAVMISHDNIIASAAQTIDTAKLKPIKTLRLISYLPLSHIAGMIVDIWVPLLYMHRCRDFTACETYFARPYDLKNGTIVNRFAFVKPTLFLGVPRVWEKIAEKLKAVGRTTTGLKLKVATWAKAKGKEHALRSQITGDGSCPSMYGIADGFVLSKVRQKLGLDECKIALTGAAPIARETLEYFASWGLPIMEVYGMSECAGATTFSNMNTYLFGTIGFSPRSYDVAILQVDDNSKQEKKQALRAKDIQHPTEEEQGEVCFRGRHIMMGYMANMKYGQDHIEEIRKKNLDAIDNEGWLHSGDKGTCDESGMFRITGRYKELIITAGGENIAPVPIEEDIKARCPAISNLIMVGDKMKYNTLLVTLMCEGATGELPGTNQLTEAARQVNPLVKTTDEASKDPAWQKYIQDAIDKTNENPAVCVSNATRIQKFRILPRDFSIQTGEFTATLKLKRSTVQEIYASEIATMY